MEEQFSTTDGENPEVTPGESAHHVSRARLHDDWLLLTCGSIKSGDFLSGDDPYKIGGVHGEDQEDEWDSVKRNRFASGRNTWVLLFNEWVLSILVIASLILLAGGGSCRGGVLENEPTCRPLPEAYVSSVDILIY